MTIARPSAADPSPLPRQQRAASRAAGARSSAVVALEPACAVLLAGGAVLGGLSVFGARDAVLAVLALAPLLLALWPRAASGAVALPVRVALALGLLPLLWLVPLPTDWLTALPGRAELLQPALAELGAGTWLPLSLAPEASWQAWLKLVPPLALFVAVLRATAATRRRLLAALVAIGLVLAGWALVQGTRPAAEGAAVFANPNHLAGLLALLLPLPVVFALEATAAAPGRRLLGALAALLLTAAVLATRSRAGACLLVLQAVAIAVWALHRQHGRRLLLALALAAVAAAVILPAAGPALLQGFALDVADGRAALLRRSFAAALTFFPLGAGPGSFAGVFATFDGLATLDTVYVNHAHDEPVQLLFELGLIGPLLYAAAAALVAQRLLARTGDGLRWACALGVGAALLHGLVDYPLRVPLPALACALLAACALSPLQEE
jgi:hypothetical protein